MRFVKYWKVISLVLLMSGTASGQSTQERLKGKIEQIDREKRTLQEEIVRGLWNGGKAKLLTMEKLDGLYLRIDDTRFRLQLLARQDRPLELAPAFLYRAGTPTGVLLRAACEAGIKCEPDPAIEDMVSQIIKRLKRRRNKR